MICPFQISTECGAVAEKLMITGKPFPKDPVPSDEEVAGGQTRQEVKNSESVE